MSNDPIRIIVAGTRTFNDFNLLTKTLNNMIRGLRQKGFTDDRIEIVTGGAAGADMLGMSYATLNNLNHTTFAAEWELYGKSAGYLRNKEMAIYASYKKGYGALIAFWDGKSKGTKLMIDLAKEYGLKTYIVNY